MMESEAMEVETSSPPPEASTTNEPVISEEPIDTDEEDIADLIALFDSVNDEDSSLTNAEKVSTLTTLLTDPHNRFGPKATSLKERSMYALARTYCAAEQYTSVVDLLTGPTGAAFFSHVTKAKCAKVVRAVLDIICSLAPTELELQATICRTIVTWTQKEKRTFLRQRVQAKLASILFLQNKYGDAQALVDPLLVELKKLDDKQLLVETHLVESKIHHGLRNVPKAKAALTASRTCANAIYVPPALQSEIDSMSGVLHCEEGDYNTAHSYFLEAFEQLDQLEGDGKVEEGKALSCLKYMMLCKILDSLTKALKLSATGGVGAKSNKSEMDISNMITGRQGVKYAGRDVDAMAAIANAASKRSLKGYEAVTQQYSQELQEDLLISHHLQYLHEQLLESNLIRIVEPYSCVEIEHIASRIEMPLGAVEKKLSQMVLDGKMNGILDQGKGHLIVYEDGEKDLAMEKGLDIIDNMDKVVSSLFVRSQALRKMVS